MDLIALLTLTCLRVWEDFFSEAIEYREFCLATEKQDAQFQFYSL